MICCGKLSPAADFLWECFFWSVCEDMVYCIAHHVMKDFLTAHEHEMMNMVSFEWNENLFREAAVEDRLEQGRAVTVLNMRKERLPLDVIARVSEMSLGKIREIGKIHSLL